MEIKGVVRARECDFNANLNVMTMFGLVEDSITALFGEYKLDGPSLKPQGLMWVFTKNKIIINRRPFWQEEYIIKSSISLISKAIVNIDTIMKDTKGNILLEAKTEACILEVESRRIIRLSNVDFSKVVLEKPLDIKFNKVEKELDYDTKKILTVSTTNIDYSLHTNNVEYIRFLSDSLKQEEYVNIKEFEIHFTHESKIGDILHVKRCNDKFIIINLDKDIVCEAIIK